jgi:hypothetical protein
VGNAATWEHLPLLGTMGEDSDPCVVAVASAQNKSG